MKISGFSYIRNGFTFHYPFLQSIQSVLPVCDEFVIAVGDSTDGTREAIEALNSPKIKIIDTIWDMSLREGGKLFAQQANIALDNITGDWGFHIQADEVIHENDLPKIPQAIQKYANDDKIDGFILPYYHFFGGYNYIRTSRAVHRYEVRVFKNNKYVRSYRDSQGFRIYHDAQDYLVGKGKKLRVKEIDAHVFHYNYVRPPKAMIKKAHFFQTFWDKQTTTERGTIAETEQWSYEAVDLLEEFTKSHPKLMQEIVNAQDWEYVYDPSKSNMKLKDRILHKFHDLTGIWLFEYKNYKRV